MKFGCYNPTEKNILYFARTLPEASWLSILEHLPQFWGFPFTFQLLLSARNFTPGGSRPKVSFFSEDMCDICGMFHDIYIKTMPWVSRHCLFNCTYMQHATNCMENCVHSNTVVKIEKKLFCTCLTWTLLIWSKCSTAYSIPSVYN